MFTRKSLLSALVCLIPCALGADSNQLDGSLSLFSVLAAVNAAGLEGGTSSVPEIRDAVRQQVLAKNPQVLSELTNFVKAHHKADLGQDLGQYISFALAVDGPPAFQVKFKRGEIPPDVEALEGFQPLMARFHEQAGIDDLWAKVQPALNKQIARYQEPVSRAILEANGYLRNPTSGYLGRHFQVYIDLLGPANQVPSRSYGDEYYIVVPPAPDPQIHEIRHAYLHYLLDPLSVKYSEEFMKKRGLIDYAQGAPVLEPGYKADFLLLATESLIKAIESRLLPGGVNAKQEVVNTALSEGYILTPFFAENLAAYEKQPASMRIYLPDLIAAIDLKKEGRRLEGVHFASAPAAGKVVNAASTVDLTAAQKQLETAEDLLYNQHNLEGARNAYLKVLEQTDDKTLHARAYYGLARTAALEKNPELAEKLFMKTLELSPDAQTHSWTEVYLGRLADLAGERDQAAKHYQAALGIQGGSEAARKAAEQGLKTTFQPRN